MNCDENELLISESLDRTLTDDELNNVHTHINQCVRCMEYYNQTIEISVEKEDKVLLQELIEDKTFNEKIMTKICEFNDFAINKVMKKTVFTTPLISVVSFALAVTLTMFT